MSRITITFLDKADTQQMLPVLFSILYENLSGFAPSGSSFEEDRAEFLANVGPAMERKERKILLLQVDGILAGYFQYFINNGLFMVEEIQLVPRYQRTGLFRQLLRFLKTVIPADTAVIEAYAYKSNIHSQSIIRSLGMECIGESETGSCWHYRGDCKKLFDRF